MINWQTVKLKEIVDLFIDYRGKTPKKSVNGIPLITAKIVKDGRILEPNEFIDEDDYPKWMTRGFPEVNDVVLTTEAPLGEVALLKNKNVALAQRIITMRCNPQLGFNPFLKYYFESPIGQYELDSRSSGTTVFGIKAAVLKELELRIPPLPEQKAIAGVLLSLDDKIDLLHRQNKTLEAMAETLFRQWFIEEAEDDWEKGKLGEMVNFLSGYSFKSNSFLPFGKYKIVTIKAVQDGYLELKNASQINIPPNNLPEYCYLNIGDILLSLTGNVGRCCLIDDSHLLLNQRVAKLQPTNSVYYPYIYFFFRQKSTRLMLEELAKGTAQLNLSPVETSNMIIDFPPLQLLSDFHAIANPILKKIIFNKQLIKHTETLRNTLLPKLMSGEVRVEL